MDVSFIVFTRMAKVAFTVVNEVDAALAIFTQMDETFT